MRALVLSGGGVKGAFQVGVLRGMLEENPDLDYDIYSGVSVGAINVAVLAAGPFKETLPKLENVWLNEMKGNESVWEHSLFKNLAISASAIGLVFIGSIISFILAPKWITGILMALGLGSLYAPYRILTTATSIYNTKPLRKLISEHLDLEGLKSSGKTMLIGSVSFQTGRYKTVDQYEPNLIDWIMGSCAFPIFFPPVTIAGQEYSDGGVREIVPIQDAIDAGATEIDVIIGSPIETNYNGLGSNLLQKVARFLEMSSSEVVVNDLQYRCEKKNIKMRIILPDVQLTDNSLDFNMDSVRKLYQAGLDEMGS